MCRRRSSRSPDTAPGRPVQAVIAILLPKFAYGVPNEPSAARCRTRCSLATVALGHLRPHQRMTPPCSSLWTTMPRVTGPACRSPRPPTAGLCWPFEGGLVFQGSFFVRLGDVRALPLRHVRGDALEAAPGGASSAAATLVHGRALHPAGETTAMTRDPTKPRPRSRRGSDGCGRRARQAKPALRDVPPRSGSSERAE